MFKDFHIDKIRREVNEYLCSHKKKRDKNIRTPRVNSKGKNIKERRDGDNSIKIYLDFSCFPRQ